MSKSQVVLLALLLTVPTVLAHPGNQPVQSDPAAEAARQRQQQQQAGQTPAETGPKTSPEDDTKLPSGYTGPAAEPYRSFFEGTWLYGQAAVTPLDGQQPVDLDADGGWIVWEDAKRSDIYAFSATAGQGFYLTNDSAGQHRPRISHGVVVWEDLRANNRSAIWMYDLQTSESRRLSRLAGDALRPATDGRVVAWTRANASGNDIVAYDLANSTEWVVAGTADREQDPYVVGGAIWWRALRFNVWDVLGYDLATKATFGASNDRYMQSAPFGNGTSPYFLTSTDLGSWSIHTYGTVDGRDTPTRFSMSSSKVPSLSGDHLLIVARDVRFQQLVIRNITNGVATHVTGNLLLETDPVVEGDHVYAVLRTAQGTRLLDLAVTPFAFSPPPTLQIVTDVSLPWVQPTIVGGKLDAGPSWTAPLTFTYRVDGGAPQPIPPATFWKFTLDNAGVPEGYHTVVIRATFREGPPVTQSFTLMTPHKFAGVDLPKAAIAYHSAVVSRMASTYVLDNPGSWVLIPLALVLAVVLAIRFALWRAGRRARKRVKEPEYVRPDEA